MMSNSYTNYFDGARISDGWQAHLNRGSLGGIDYAVGVGTPIKAPTSGRIANIANNGTGGHTVTLYHANGFKTQFMHLSRFVSEGTVNKGDIIGYTGGAKGSDGAGSSTGPHCHTHLITSGGTRVNPLNYVGQDFSRSVSDTGNASVKNIQNLLNSAGGYGLAVDGDYGPKTKAAAKDFQSRYGLLADGIVGPITTAKLNEVIASNIAAAKKIAADEIKKIADAKAKAEADAKAAAEAEAKKIADAKAKAEAEAKKVATPVAPVVAKTVKTTEVKVAAKEKFVPVEVPVDLTNHANNIGVIIGSAATRKKVYAGYVAVSFLITNTVVAYSTIEAPIPAWLKIALAVLGNSAVAFGGLAIANTGDKK
jgi:peptidoglycan hydrolase-like protein with peptidoglycan-binding domain